MDDMRPTIIPKSDQLNADSLLSGPITIKITKVLIQPGDEQPVSVHFDGDEGKPWKPCKSMCRVMVQCWGPDASKYAGKSLTLYRDPKVLWGGMAVGGIRISHMSDIDGKFTMALTATKGSRKPFTVLPMTHHAASPVMPPSEAHPTPSIDDESRLEGAIRTALANCADLADVEKVVSRWKVTLTRQIVSDDLKSRIERMIEYARGTRAATQPGDLG